MKKLVLLFPIFLLGLPSAWAAAPKQPPQRPCFHLHKQFETRVGYCQAVRVGNTLYISGTAAPGDMTSAVQQVYETLKATLNANGLTFADVVKEHVYTTNLDAFKKNEALRKKFYGDTLPAATWVQVQRLFTPKLVLEVELVAVYPD